MFLFFFRQLEDYHMKIVFIQIVLIKAIIKCKQTVKPDFSNRNFSQLFISFKQNEYCTRPAKCTTTPTDCIQLAIWTGTR